MISFKLNYLTELNSFITQTKRQEEEKRALSEPIKIES